MTIGRQSGWSSERGRKLPSLQHEITDSFMPEKYIMSIWKTQVQLTKIDKILFYVSFFFVSVETSWYKLLTQCYIHRKLPWSLYTNISYIVLYLHRPSEISCSKVSIFRLNPNAKYISLLKTQPGNPSARTHRWRLTLLTVWISRAFENMERYILLHIVGYPISGLSFLRIFLSRTTSQK